MKPSEFYVGVLDFFAILLPGAIATAILAPLYANASLIVPLASEASKWAAFLVCSYFAGHLIFLLGSCIDRLYDPLRRRLNPHLGESAFHCATRVRNLFIQENERTALNTFQWSRSVLLSTCPAAAEDVHRLEADSKFFRSMLVVGILASVVFFADGKRAEGFVALGLVIPCFARYYERRLKSTTQAYTHVVALYGLGKLAARDKAGDA